MGFDLTNDKGTYLRFSPSGWSLALTLAERFGWSPSGTLAPKDDPDADVWPGEYQTNEGQRVTSTDAAALAAACERALASPDYVERTITTYRDLLAEVERELGRKVTPGLAPFGATEVIQFRKRLEELMRFCREGEFVIE